MPIDDRDIEIAKVHKKLKDRGFVKNGVNAVCPTCNLQAVGLYELQHPKMGGRSIEWCMHCDTARSWKRPAGKPRFEDAPFNLYEFLA